MFLSDNKIDGNGNQLLAEQFSFNANSFSHVGDQAHALAGWAISNTAMYIGNQSPFIAGLGTQFVNASRISLPNPKNAMNLRIDIQEA